MIEEALEELKEDVLSVEALKELRDDDLKRLTCFSPPLQGNIND